MLIVTKSRKDRLLSMRSIIILFIFIIYQAYPNKVKLNPIVFSNAEVVNENTFRIPFKLVDRLIVVEATLAGKEGAFIVDTGSQNLILNEVHYSNKYKHPKRFKKTTGVLDHTDIYEKVFDEFVVEGLKLENPNTHIVNLSHIEKSKKIHLLGIIGYSILKDYEVFIDLYLNQITLSKTDKNGKKLDKRGYLEKISDSIAFNLRNHTIVLNIKINDENMKFGLDSGAEFNQINTPKLKKVTENFIPSKRIKLIGMTNEKTELMAGKLFGIRLNERIYFGPMHTIMTNLDNLNVAFGTQLDGVLGFEFFAQKRTIINYKKEMLYFIEYPVVSRN